ncbi:Menaquinol-cytochrome c reductase cytochrome b subunit [Anatilimnocola aggregata]|uniref:Menaquinol-cytochrome c reductase cytochrome b subunit n=1 Tax=Anatilimnocola aggregata TaxID=2528021 RepID=A0A517YDF8_9BACT|nr:cytochrome b N-terminal domain-containing protein [Anatilimnocola aggregata]QDU28229.1 Menaquinol-cytochrome c reductase cytochrome b subunit [Anatilimnocola aggregata]
MLKWLTQIGGWVDHRLGLGAFLVPMLEHPIPRGAAGPMGWWYVFGSASMTLLAIQILTGIGLSLVYVPAPDQAFESLEYLNYEQPMGWFLRALHYYAGSAMVVMVLVHMTQVFLHGSYKYPRELTWVVGVFLLLCTLGMFFSGQILRWDPDAYWGLAVAGSMAGRVPVAGPWIVQLLHGGAVIGGSSLSRFFALHVFIIPGALMSLLVVHLWLVLRCGVSAPPNAQQPVDPRTYDADYHTELHRTGVPFFGDAVVKDACFSALVVIVVVALAAIMGPKGPSELPDPTLGGANPRPEWPFLWLFALLSMSPPAAETFIILVLPVLLIGLLLLVPFISNRGQRAPSQRPVAVLIVVISYTVLGVLTYEGYSAPWSPAMNAWSGDPVPVSMVKQSSPLQLQGSLVFQNKNCRNCHALAGVGGRRGPDLSTIGTRLTRDQLIDQISNGTPGGGNMPAYGQQMGPHEMTAVVDFLVSLRPAGQPPARVATVDPPQ